MAGAIATFAVAHHRIKQTRMCADGAASHNFRGLVVRLAVTARRHQLGTGINLHSTGTILAYALVTSTVVER
jgi:hypothetical protein